MISDQLASLITSNYDLPKIDAISNLEGGYWNQTLRLETGSGDFVLRISRPRTRPESLFYQHDLMRFMKARIPEVLSPVALGDGKTFFVHENRVVTLLPFMTGENASRKVPAHQRSAAEMLAKLHRSGLEYPDKSKRFGYAPLMEFNWQQNPDWYWTEVKDLLKSGAQRLKKSLIPPIGERAFYRLVEIAARRRQLAEELHGVYKWIEELKKSSRTLLSAPIHGDYYPSNLLVKNDKIRAVLDWDECRPEWLAYELGRALWEFCRADDVPAMKTEYTQAFLNSYRSAGGVVSESDFDLLVPFIRTVRVQEILFSLGEALRGEWWDPEYTLYNFEALDNIERGTLFV